MLTYSYGYSLLLLILSFLLSEVAGTVSGGYLELHIYTRLSAIANFSEISATSW
jgi:hypothetical protein